MNKNVAVFILLSIGFGLGAVYLAKNWINKNEAKNLQEGQVQVISVVAPILTGSVIETKHLKVSTLPESMLPKGAITSLEDATGMIAKQKLYPGEILHKERVAVKGEGSSLASLIGKNMRAVSIRVNDVVGVAGFILPGNRVDVLTTFNKGSGPYTEVILSNIKILAVDQRASNDENKPQIVRAVTIEVSLEQAETLMSAKRKGSLQLALRNPNDKTMVATAQEEAIEEQKKVEEQPTLAAVNIKQRNRNKIEIIRGTKQETVQVSNKN